MDKNFQQMMQKMFQSMDYKQKLEFISNMMPTCLGMMTAGLNQDEKKDFAEKVPELMKNTLGKLLQNENKEASC